MQTIYQLVCSLQFITKISNILVIQVHLSTVKLNPGIDRGSVEVWNGYAYDGVCATDFDDNDATVVCRQTGFQYGMALCCLSFNNKPLTIRVNNVGCIGTESNFRDCPYTNSTSICTDGNYASVVCSNSQHTGGKLTLAFTI